ncbi:uncharacterized protein CLUP02_14119 [Colletotrichum lupini]|uniref:Uncharacterized protein n=1 Tax=Colletotrichum lupini TaxID=145971 RepID=A0A9Q8T3L4_9PEZI|nr:uncharacterized protein CLUP02_14119 [Colletotrichum lupini]UQC88594.1 hypothetical protein CLUP02_14119 [Colletotrichum lupini]
MTTFEASNVINSPQFELLRNLCHVVIIYSRL